MKAVVNSDGTFSVEVEGSKTTELFEEISKAQEVFGGLICEDKEGNKSEKIILRVRSDDEDNKYYEAVCMDSSQPKLKWSKQKFGCKKIGGGLYPKGGWVKWDGDKKVEIDLMTGEPVEKD